MQQSTRNFRFNNILYDKSNQQNVYDAVRINVI